jgi:hypothetical protein
VSHKYNYIFKEYKNKYEGKTAALFGSGPTAASYKPLEDVDINVGCNFIGDLDLFNQKKDNYKLLDYYFFGDKGRSMDESFKVKGAKFGACEVDGFEHPLHYSEEEVKSFGAFPMAVKNSMPPTFYLDISSNPTCGMSVIFHALNFLFYTGVSKIYIIGCDCNPGRQCFDGREIINSGDTGTYEIYTIGWHYAKKFIEDNNLNTQIVSINPVGLKNLFTELNL